mmetsp:Transcript_2660/g.5402  ORF Transcript_2660/g.5402 Transcript_2660/m.5402 type:complete len:80 (-) Transcript_2660:56-295(-)
MAPLSVGRSPDCYFAMHWRVSNRAQGPRAMSARNSHHREYFLCLEGRRRYWKASPYSMPAVCFKELRGWNLLDVLWVLW